MKILPIIMSGGNGSRLWPKSRAQYPKQFLALVNDKSMLQNTLARVSHSQLFEDPVVIANEEHRFIIAEQSRGINIKLGGLVLEPSGRNTAPAVAAAAHFAIDKFADDDVLLLVLAADHAIEKQQEFIDAVKQAKESALDGKLVTFGVTPTYAETGYGYIKAKDKGGVQEVESFVEKPDQSTAEKYLDSGNYYWNSGMFLFSARQFLSELGALAPEIHSYSRLAYKNAIKDMDFIRLDKTFFLQNPECSIDCAVMEKTKEAVVIPMDAGWCDVGSWLSLWALSGRDKNNNAIKGDVILDNVSNCYIQSENKLIAAIGLENLIIVDSGDALLIADKKSVQNVKKIVSCLKGNHRQEAFAHKKVYRPWGSYESIDTGERFEVKRITVNPGQKLSVQKHHHRAEHWVVVKGTAKASLGGRQQLVTENQSIYIPAGEIHSLENPYKVPLQLIEVKTGSYLSEDDIIRVEDVYRRETCPA